MKYSLSPREVPWALPLRFPLGSDYMVSVLGREEGYTIKYTPPPEFPRVKPEGTPEGGGVYLTVYPEPSPNTDILSF